METGLEEWPIWERTTSQSRRPRKARQATDSISESGTKPLLVRGSRYRWRGVFRELSLGAVIAANFELVEKHGGADYRTLDIAGTVADEGIVAHSDQIVAQSSHVKLIQQ